MRDTRYTSYIMWNNDMQPESNAPNAYGSHPFMMSLTREGNAHGIAFHNSHAMEVSLQPTPAATFRALGGDFDIRYKQYGLISDYFHRRIDLSEGMF